MKNLPHSVNNSSHEPRDARRTGRTANAGAAASSAAGATDRARASAQLASARPSTPVPSAQELAQAITTTKKEIIDRIAADTHQKRAAVKRTVQAFLDTVIDELSAGNRLELRDFGVFEIRERAARTAQNPKTLERVAVPARKTVKFKVGRLMKESVEEPERLEPPKRSRSARD